MAKSLEPYQLFFLEDPVAPENLDWLKMIRAQSSTPISMGELFTNINEWKPLIQQQLIDFIRCDARKSIAVTLISASVRGWASISMKKKRHVIR